MTVAGPDANPTPSADHELVITRLFDAPRELVFAAWTDRERALHWWGPKDFTATIVEFDLRPGGTWRAILHAPDGKDYPQRGTCREIVPPERLVYTFKWDNESDPETLITVTFAERGAQTEMTFRQAPFDSVESRDSHNDGWNESFDRLAEYVDGQS